VAGRGAELLIGPPRFAGVHLGGTYSALCGRLLWRGHSRTSHESVNGDIQITQSWFILPPFLFLSAFLRPTFVLAFHWDCQRNRIPRAASASLWRTERAGPRRVAGSRLLSRVRVAYPAVGRRIDPVGVIVCAPRQRAALLGLIHPAHQRLRRRRVPVINRPAVSAVRSLVPPLWSRLRSVIAAGWTSSEILLIGVGLRLLIARRASSPWHIARRPPG